MPIKEAYDSAYHRSPGDSRKAVARIMFAAFSRDSPAALDATMADLAEPRGMSIFLERLQAGAFLVSGMLS